MDAATLTRKSGHLLGMFKAMAKDSSQAKNFPRFLQTRGKSPVEVRLPWLPFDLIDHLAGEKPQRVFEYGGGGSTLWFLDEGASVVTVEHDRVWASELAAAIGPEATSDLHHIDAGADYADYVHSVRHYPERSFDLIVVDGRERVRCVEAAMPYVSAGGMLIVDDVERERYEPAFELLADWPRRDFFGLAPYKPAMAYSSVWTAPE